MTTPYGVGFTLLAPPPGAPNPDMGMETVVTMTRIVSRLWHQDLGKKYREDFQFQVSKMMCIQQEIQ